MSIENGVTSESSPPKRLSPHRAGIDTGIPTDYASREIQVLETRYFELLGRLRRHGLFPRALLDQLDHLGRKNYQVKSQLRPTPSGACSAACFRLP